MRDCLGRVVGIAILIAVCSAISQAEFYPLKMEFKRLASRRFIFDNNLSLSELNPSTVVALDLMHPWETVNKKDQPCAYALQGGNLVISNKSESVTRSNMFAGGINPFAVYDIDLKSLKGQGRVGVEISQTDFTRRLIVCIDYTAGKSIANARYYESGEKKLNEMLNLADIPVAPFTWRVQMMGTGIAVFVEKDGVSALVGSLETNKLLDFREKATFTDMKFRIYTELKPESEVVLSAAKSYLTCGTGQADIRMVTSREGAPYWKDDRLWFLFTARGWLLPHPTQGVFSLDPTVFNPRFEGTIVFDMGDGKLRNDVGTHLFYDAEADEFRGWSCNFSTVADGNNRYPSGINYVQSKHRPLKGFVVMKARAAENMTYKHEDPCGFWDQEADKWRLLMSSFHEGIKASLWESDHWDGPWEKIAGPVPRDSTGTLIQKIGDTRYIFAGSSDQAVYIYTYPGLELLGELNMDYKPWNASVKNGRVWPNIFPAPEGHPYPYLALMMDRANFPGYKKGWIYGALHLYGAIVNQ